MSGFWTSIRLLFVSLILGDVFTDAKYTTDSVVKCDLSSISKSSFESVRVAAHAASMADAALCGNNTNAEAVAESTALAISRTFADAFLGSIVDCYAEGYAHYTINGHSLATAQAWAFAEAFAEASAVAKTCHKCLAASELLAHSYAEVFITAAKETEVYISGVASGDHDRDEDDYTLIARDLVEKTMAAFAQVIVKARSKVNECQASATVRVATGDENGYNKVECHVNAAAASDYRVQDAVRVASEELALSVCDLEDRSTQVLHVEAEAIAKAFAIAIAGISAECKIEGHGTACAVGFSEITQAAEAVAEAYAVAFVSATAECNELCHTEQADLSAAIGSVLVTASAKVYKYHCTGAATKIAISAIQYQPHGPDSYFEIQDFEADIVESSVTAISQLLAQATIATNDDRTTVCMVEMEFDSAIEPEEPPELLSRAGQSPGPAPSGLAVDQPMEAASLAIVPASAVGPQPPVDVIDEESTATRGAAPSPVDTVVSGVDQARIDAAASAPETDPEAAAEFTESTPAPSPEGASTRQTDPGVAAATDPEAVAESTAPTPAPIPGAGSTRQPHPGAAVDATESTPAPAPELAGASSLTSGAAPDIANMSEAGPGTLSAGGPSPDAAGGGVAATQASMSTVPEPVAETEHVPPQVSVPAAAEAKPAVDEPHPDADVDEPHPDVDEPHPNASVSASKHEQTHHVDVNVVTATGTSVDGESANATPHKPLPPHPPSPAPHSLPGTSAQPAVVPKPKPDTSPQAPPPAPIHSESHSDTASKSTPAQRHHPKPATRRHPNRSRPKQHSNRHGHKRQPHVRKSTRRPSTTQTRRRMAQPPGRPHRGPKKSKPKPRSPPKARKRQLHKRRALFKRLALASKRHRQKVMSKRQPPRPRRRRVNRDRRSRSARKTPLPRRIPRRSSRRPQKKTHKKPAGGAVRKRRPRAARRTRTKRRGQ